MAAVAGAAPVGARVAGAAQVLLGLGFGAGSLLTVWHLAQHGELPMTPFGFRSMSGPFEALGRDRFAALGVGLAAVCAADVVAGAWLWQGRRRGLLLGLVTAIPAFVLALGFALPFLLVGVPFRVVAGLASRGSLR
jgi:hypothetical protein